MNLLSRWKRKVQNATIRLGQKRCNLFLPSADVNQKRNFKIFELFTFNMIEEARSKPAMKIFRHGATSARLIRLRFHIASQFSSERRFADAKAASRCICFMIWKCVCLPSAALFMNLGPCPKICENDTFYVFDFACNTLKELYKIHRHETFFVVLEKQKLQLKCVSWR